MTVLHVPHSLDSGNPKPRRKKPRFLRPRPAIPVKGDLDADFGFWDQLPVAAGQSPNPKQKRTLIHAQFNPPWSRARLREAPRPQTIIGINLSPRPQNSHQSGALTPKTSSKTTESDAAIRAVQPSSRVLVLGSRFTRPSHRVPGKVPPFSI